VWKERHPGIVFGCDWNPLVPNLIATACEDGCIRVFDTSKAAGTSKIAELKGHTKKAFNVQWSPFDRNLLLSSSDDTTARVWDYTQGSRCVLQGHTMNVRAVHWSYAFPNICLTGSWDSCIKVWDIRDGTCLHSVSDHCGDVYGLDASPHRPFCFVSSSRDTTLRTWTMESNVADYAFALLAGLPSSDVVGDSNEVAPQGQRQKLCGKAIHDLVAAIGPRASNAEALPLLARYFCAPSGPTDLLQIAKGIVTGVACTVEGATVSSFFRVEDTETMVDFSIAQMSRTRAAGRKRDAQMNDIAQMHLQMGRVREYCECMISIGHWDKALAVAPGASLEYWRSLSERYANEAADAEDQSVHMIASGQIGSAVELYLQNGMSKDAFVLAAMHVNGKTPNATTTGPAENGGDSAEVRQALVTKVTHEMGAQHQIGGEPIKVASCQLAGGHTDAAVQTLVVNGEYFLAYLLCRMFQKPEPNALFEYASEMSNKLGSASIALALAQKVRGESPLAVDKVCARCARNEKEAFYGQANLRPPASFSDAGSSALADGSLHEAVRCFVLAGDVAKAGDVAVQALHAVVGSGAWDYSSARVVIQHMGCLPIDSLETELRAQILAYASFFGLFEAMWRGYYPILPGLKNCVDHSANSLPATQKEQMMALLTKLAPTQQKGTAMMAMNATGSLLPTAAHRATVVSAVSARPLTGTTVTLDDQVSQITRSEAIMWRTVNPFSPLNTGRLLDFV